MFKESRIDFGGIYIDSICMIWVRFDKIGIIERMMDLKLDVMLR